MKEENLTVPIKRIKKYSSYKGESHGGRQYINRFSRRTSLIQKWLTDMN